MKYLFNTLDISLFICICLLVSFFHVLKAVGIEDFKKLSCLPSLWPLLAFLFCWSKGFFIFPLKAEIINTLKFCGIADLTLDY